jgi:hypothetical protein
MSALVIKQWQVHTRPPAGESHHIHIRGREGGLFAWLLARMGIDPVTTIQVNLERVQFASASLAGVESRMIPLQNVCSTIYGYHKPWKSAVLILLSFAAAGSQFTPLTGGDGVGFVLLTAIGALAALAHYFLNRTLTLGFVEHSGVVSSIRFKRSVIENIDVNEKQAQAVCVLVQRLVEAKARKTLLATR